MTQATEKQIAFLRSLATRIENKVVAQPKKVDRWFNPVKAHEQHVAYARDVIAKLDAGEMTSGAASTHISSMKLWA